MTGNFIDHIRFQFSKAAQTTLENAFFLDTDYGRIRILDTKSNKPILINAPDGPNVIEHQLPLITALSKHFRVICFEFPGIGLSYPNRHFNYSMAHGSALLLQIMDILKIDKANLLLSCSNGFYAMTLAEQRPDKIQHLFLAQTPSFSAMLQWTHKSIPSILKTPVIGQIANALQEKRLAKIWYQYALSKESDKTPFQKTALHSLEKGGCFCLSGLANGLKQDEDTELNLKAVPTTLFWGAKDFTHRKTDKNTILEHIKDCKIVEFPNCGHFPELEHTESVVRMINETVFA